MARIPKILLTYTMSRLLKVKHSKLPSRHISALLLVYICIGITGSRILFMTQGLILKSLLVSVITFAPLHPAVLLLRAHLFYNFLFDEQILLSYPRLTIRKLVARKKPKAHSWSCFLPPFYVLLFSDCRGYHGTEICANYPQGSWILALIAFRFKSRTFPAINGAGAPLLVGSCPLAVSANSEAMFSTTAGILGGLFW